MRKPTAKPKRVRSAKRAATPRPRVELGDGSITAVEQLCRRWRDVLSARELLYESAQLDRLEEFDALLHRHIKTSGGYDAIDEFLVLLRPLTSLNMYENVREFLAALKKHDGDFRAAERDRDVRGFMESMTYWGVPRRRVEEVLTDDDVLERLREQSPANVADFVLPKLGFVSKRTAMREVQLAVDTYSPRSRPPR